MEGYLTINQCFTHINVRLMLAPEDRAISVIGGILMDTHSNSAMAIHQLKRGEQQWHGTTGIAADPWPVRGGRRWGWSRDVGLLVLIGLLVLPGWGTAPLQGQDLLQQPSQSIQALTPSRHVTRPGPYGQLPLNFEANQGQTDAQVQFLAHGQGYILFLTAREAVFAFRPPAAHPLHPSRLVPRPGAVQDTPDTARAVVRMQLLGANSAPQVVGLEDLPGKAHYFRGNDPQQWRTNVPTYAKVQYTAVYPGVDLIYYGQSRQLEYDFVVAPGVDPAVITLGFEGVDHVDVDAQGDLVLGTPGGPLRFQKPVVYQEQDGGRHAIAGGYVRKGLHQVGFHVAAYDVARPLVIDPVLSYATYLGGSGEDLGSGIAVDAAGNAYVTGQTESTNFPTTLGAFQTAQPGFVNVFVSKLNAAGSALLYSTYLGGTQSAAHVGRAIAVDASGNAYITGFTGAADFPTTPGAFQTTIGGNFDAFVAKLNPTGSALLYSTFLGGSSDDGGFDRGGIAVDAVGNAYVTGETISADFPTTPGAFQPTPGYGFGRVQDAFVSKLNATGSALVYSTYLGATDTAGYTIAVDAAGNAYVAGFTNSADFPTTPGAFSSSGGGFITKLSAAGSALVYSTRLSGADFCSGIAVDTSGNAYVTGLTRSPDFPTVHPLQPTLHSSGGNAFVAKLTPDGTALVYATYLGGSGTVVSRPPRPPVTFGDTGLGIAIDAAGNAYVTGNTSSSDFPITSDAFQTTFGGGFGDAFVSKLNATGSALLYSTYLGGNDIDNGTGIVVNAAGNAYVAGYSFSSNFPTTSDAFQTTFGGVVDAFVVKLASPTFAGTPGTANCHGQSVSALTQQFGSLDAAALALGFPSVQALQDAIQEFCEE
jgi:Beta-propeller repeat